MKIGPGLELERLGVRVVNGHADHVAGQHVAGELQPVKAAVDAARQRMGERGLPDARHILDEKVPAREQAHQRQPDRFRLAAENLIERIF